MTARVALLVTSFLLLPTVSAAQDIEESCREVMDATAARADSNVYSGEGGPHDRMICDFAHRPDGGPGHYVSTCQMFSEDLLVSTGYTQVRCSGDTLFVLHRIVQAPDGTTEQTVTYEPPQPRLVVGAAEGESWDWNGTIVYNWPEPARTFPAMQVATILAPEIIETPAGTFESQHAQLELTVVLDSFSRVITRQTWFYTDPDYLVLRDSFDDGDEIWTLQSITQRDGD